MVEKCFPCKGPEGHPWLTGIYKLMGQWSRAWLQHTYTNGMRSSQLSESCNSNLRKYMKRNFNLSEFFTHFNRMLERKRRKYLRLDFKSRNSTPLNLFKDSPVTKQFASQYTRTIFNKFIEDEYAPTLSIAFTRLPQDVDSRVKTFDVYQKLESDETTDHRIVRLSVKEQTVICTCHRFELDGLLCRHAIRVIAILGSIGEPTLLPIPQKYILERWTIEAGILTEVQHQLPSKETDASRYQGLCAEMSKIAKKICHNAPLTASVMKALKEMDSTCTKMVQTENKKDRENKTRGHESPMTGPLVGKKLLIRPKDKFRPNKRQRAEIEIRRTATRKKKAERAKDELTTLAL
ncbi:Protein FAR1-RELATED SEQUENCE 5 [Linum grandiflorum]